MIALMRGIVGCDRTNSGLIRVILFRFQNKSALKATANSTCIGL